MRPTIVNCSDCVLQFHVVLLSLTLFPVVPSHSQSNAEYNSRTVPIDEIVSDTLYFG
jgi:hypothetical protein